MAYDINQVESVIQSLGSVVLKFLDDEFNKGRIKGTDYANTFNSLLNTVIQVSFDAPIKDKQIEQSQAQIDVYKAQEELYEAQKIKTEAETKQVDRTTRSFDDNILLKLFNAQASIYQGWLASGNADDVPRFLKNDAISDLYDQIKLRTSN